MNQQWNQSEAYLGNVYQIHPIVEKLAVLVIPIFIESLSRLKSLVTTEYNRKHVKHPLTLRVVIKLFAYNLTSITSNIQFLSYKDL